jgi:hypothetical protein
MKLEIRFEAPRESDDAIEAEVWVGVGRVFTGEELPRIARRLRQDTDPQREGDD